VRSLHRGDFIDDAHNVVLIGGPGTGKTHLATAIGLHAIAHHHRRVRFFSTIELVNVLEQEKANGKPGQMAHRLVHCDLVVLDELGYLPCSQAGGALLFHLLSKLYEKTSVMITTNLSFLGMGECVRRLKAHHGVAGPPHAPLSYRRNRQRQLSLQAQLHEAGKGD